MEKGLSLKEKYGGERGWRLLLRFDETQKEQCLEYRENVGGMFSGLECRVKDDRTKPIELIRRPSEASPKEVIGKKLRSMNATTDRKNSVIHTGGEGLL